MFSVNSIQLPLAGWIPTADGVGTWQNGAGDVLSAHYFPMPPDLPVPLHDIDGIREAYRRLLAKRGAIVELALDNIQGCDALRAIFELQQQPRGVLYMAVIMIPFREHNFMVKVTCQEESSESDPRFPGDPLVRARMHMNDTLMRVELTRDVRDLAPFSPSV